MDVVQTFVNEDETHRVRIRLGFEPGEPPAPHIRPVLVGGVRAFFEAEPMALENSVCCREIFAAFAPIPSGYVLKDDALVRAVARLDDAGRYGEK